MITVMGSTVVLKPSVTVTLYSYLVIMRVERSCLRKNNAFCISPLAFTTSNVEPTGCSVYVKIPPTPISPSVTDKVAMSDGVDVFEILKTYGPLVNTGACSFTPRTFMTTFVLAVAVPSVHCTTKL